MARRLGRVVAYRAGWRIYMPGHGYIYSHRGVPFTDRRNAQAVLDSIRTRAMRDPVDVVVEEFRAPRRAEHTVEQWARRFLEDFRSRVERYDRSTNTLAEYERWAADHWKPLFERTVFELDRSHIHEYAATLATRGLHVNTIAKVLGGLHRLLTFVHERTPKRLGFVIPDFPRSSRLRHHPRVVPLEVQDRILAAVPADRRGIFLALRLGLRPSEARALDVADYDFARRLLDVKHECRVKVTPLAGGQRKNRLGALSKRILSFTLGLRNTYTRQRDSRVAPSFAILARGAEWDPRIVGQ